MDQVLVQKLKENREKIAKISGKYDANDYSINQEIDREFIELLGNINIKEIKNKSELYSLIYELSSKTLDKTIVDMDHFSTIDDFSWGNDLRRNELYLKDLFDQLNNNLNNIVLLSFYSNQIDLLISDLSKHNWGKDFADKMCADQNYSSMKKYIDKTVEQTKIGLYFNPEFQNDAERIKIAVKYDCNDINYVSPDLKNDVNLMIELININPACYFGMSNEIKANKEVAKAIIAKDYLQFITWADSSLKNEKFLAECGLSSEGISEIMRAVQELPNQSVENGKKATSTFNNAALKCGSFISGLNKCSNNEELVNYINNIVDGFSDDENTPTELGAGSMFSKDVYKNGGVYNGFINPKIRITNSTMGYSYRIYDRAYLYSFALGLRNLNLQEGTNILPYVMKFLDSYFGFPKDNIDRRDDVLYNFAVNHAEEFYKSHNIPISEEMGAVNQMQMNGDFPLSALKGTYSAQCVERSALAQNLMKLCGYNASIMYGDCESRKQVEGHCWNAITDENKNICLLDFSNTVYYYQNGKFTGRIPYSFSISSGKFIDNDGVLEMPDYHYENGKRVPDNRLRTYAVGKTLNKNEDLTSENRLK